jgi:hypothetical protein
MTKTSDLQRWSAVLKPIDAFHGDMRALTCTIVEQCASRDKINNGCANCTITFHERRAPAAYLAVWAYEDKQEDVVVNGVCEHCLKSGRIDRLLTHLQTHYNISATNEWREMQKFRAWSKGRKRQQGV